MKRTQTIKRLAAAMLLGAFASLAGAGEYTRRPDNTAAGLLLDEIDLQTDPKEQLALLERFHAQYPANPSTAWVCDRIRSRSIQLERWDRVAEMSRKLLAIDPEDSLSALLLLQASEKLNDPVRLRESIENAEAVANAAASPKAVKNQSPEAVRKMEAARQTRAYAEQARVRLILQANAGPQRLEMLESFEKRYPKSELAPRLAILRAVSAWQSGDLARTAEAAGRVLATDAESIPARFLMSVAQAGQGSAEAGASGEKLMAAVLGAKKPACLGESDWNLVRDAYLTASYVAAGLGAAERQDAHLAERLLTAAQAFGEPGAPLAEFLAGQASGMDLTKLRSSVAAPDAFGGKFGRALEGCLEQR